MQRRRGRASSGPTRRRPGGFREAAQAHFGAAGVADRSSSDFLMLASHEMRGPIAVLRGYLQMLMAGTLGEVSPRVAEALPLLMVKVDHMASLVEHILDAARIEDNSLVLRLELLDLRDVAEECTASAAGFVAAGQRIHLQLPDRAVTVLGDRVRLSTILGNLLDNAIKYSPDGAGLSSSLPRIGRRQRFE